MFMGKPRLRAANCIAYTDPRLAAVYDILNPWTEADDFYVELVGDGLCHVLDMGCGTGRLATAIAAKGHLVTGADPTRSMLDIALVRQGGTQVRWVESAAAELALETRFDLIVMNGHVFQVFLEDSEVAAVLDTLKRHLAPGGRLAFETRNPAVREWESWVRDKTTEYLEVPGHGAVEVYYELTSVDGEYVTFETHFIFAGEAHHTAPHTLRFMPQRHLAGLLEESGFTQVEWYGDWDRSLVSDASPEIIAIANKPVSH